MPKGKRIQLKQFQVNSPRLMDSSISIDVSNHYQGLAFSQDKLNLFFEQVFTLHGNDIQGVLSVVFLNREKHTQIHGQFLNDFRSTDVITFPADPTNGMVGEICASVDQAKEEARDRNLPVAEELSLYLIHGWLHLIGFDDCDEMDREIMIREQINTMESIRKSNAWPDFTLSADQL